MWTIGEVKRAGWRNVKKYFWPAYFVAIIASLFSGSGQVQNVQNFVSEDSSLYLSIVSSILLIVFVVAALVKIFVGNPLEVGGDRFYMESRALGETAGIGKVLWVFRSSHYLNVVKIMFLRDLYTVLWGMLLIIPGIVKSYEYIMIPYILSENPEANSRDVFALTKDMMTGSKFQYFCLSLSFIGWLLLAMVIAGAIGSALFGLLLIWPAIFVEFVIVALVSPYIYASTAEVYACMRKSITGFPFNGYGVPEVEETYIQADNGTFGGETSQPGENEKNDDERDYFR